MSLNLTRHRGEEIQIGENITVRIGQIRDNAVTLLIDAPKEITVDRMEVYRRKRLHLLQKKQPTAMELTQ